MSLNLGLALPFKTFCYKRKKTYSEDTIWINGTFKEEGYKKIIKGDIFEAHKVLGCSLEELYKLYIDWFNYTLRYGEKKRIFVAVKEYKEGLGDDI